MNLTDFQYDLLRQFKAFGEMIAPFEDGGILNYLFEQITVNQSLSINNNNNNTSVNVQYPITLLKFIEFNDTLTFFTSMISHMLLDSVQPTNVFNVLLMNRNLFNATLPTSSSNTPMIITRKYLAVIIIEVLVILIAFTISICYFLFICPPTCIEQKSSLNYLKYFEITQVLHDKKCLVDVNHSDEHSIMSDSLSDEYIRTNKVSRRSVEWMLANEENISVNSSDIYINDPQYKKKQSLSSNQSFTNSTQSSALTNQHEIHQPLDQNHINSFLMHYYLSSSSTQFRNQLRIYLILKIIIYSLICLNICLCVICLYTMDASFGYVEPKFTDSSTSSTIQKSFRNVLMNEVLDKLPVYLQEIVSQGQVDTKSNILNEFEQKT
ncbi:unnamed protein product [Schistosoma turkestanicum]|nr:unnamed protein product [Schistosoma turkestanicum]